MISKAEEVDTFQWIGNMKVELLLFADCYENERFFTKVHFSAFFYGNNVGGVRHSLRNYGVMILLRRTVYRSVLSVHFVVLFMFHLCAVNVFFTAVLKVD